MEAEAEPVTVGDGNTGNNGGGGGSSGGNEDNHGNSNGGGTENNLALLWLMVGWRHENVPHIIIWQDCDGTLL
jgi:hypothetical protein